MLSDVERRPELPAQSWLLQIAGNSSCLSCGDNIEVWPEGFFEGAWAGDFGKRGFASCADVFGSGARYVDGRWRLVPPSHTCEAIYALNLRRGEWLVSNSLAFIYSRATFSFSRRNSLAKKFIGIVRGIDRSPTRISTSSGTLHIIHHHNVDIAEDRLTVCPKIAVPAFANYQDYLSYLCQVVSRTAANAADPKRRRAYELCATVSSGYDSPACATVARRAGCTRAITFANARGGESDDGSAIAQALGLEVRTFRRGDFGPANIAHCAEFYGTGMGGEDAAYDAVRGHLSRTILVTGFHGDKIWDRWAKPTTTLRRGDVSGSSLAEFRLVEGFIHLPLPFCGATHHDQIRAISNSAEMLPFAIGGPYDRPIPRRIAEEAGVQRDLFGQKKKAISLLLHMDRNLLSGKARQAIIENLKVKTVRERLVYKAGCFRYALPNRTAVLGARLASVARVKDQYVDKISRLIVYLFSGMRYAIFEHSHPFNRLAFEWSLRKVDKRYEI